MGWWRCEHSIYFHFLSSIILDTDLCLNPKRSSLVLNADAAPPVPDWMADLASRAGGDTSTAKEKAESDIRWVGEFADELTVSIALREWEQAVSLVERGQFLLI